MDSTQTVSAEEALNLWLQVPRLPISKRERRLINAGETTMLHFSSPVKPEGEFDLPVTTWGNAAQPLVFLMHGWGGHRGQLAAFADPLVAAGFSVASFDAPSHGDVPGTQASGYQMAAAIHTVLGGLGQPYAIIAHSLGTMAVALALQDWLAAEKLVFFGPTRRLEDVIEPFVKFNHLPLELVPELRSLCEKYWGARVWETTALDIVVPKVSIPALGHP